MAVNVLEGFRQGMECECEWKILQWQGSGVYVLVEGVNEWCSCVCLVRDEYVRTECRQCGQMLEE